MATATLLALAVALLIFPQTAQRIAGFSSLGTPSAQQLDEELAVEDRESPLFLADRNQVQVTVPREMSVGMFLRLYQLPETQTRSQIAAQLGKDLVSDREILPAGQKLVLSLTPLAEGL